MATNAKPTLLFAHGAWHFPESYAKFTTALRDAGLEVHVPQLLSMNQSRPPNADLYSDSDLIRSYATSLIEAGRSVAVLMHSYGGQAGTNALYGLSKKSRAANDQPGGGGVTHLIYMAGFASMPGKSMIDKVDEFGHMFRMPVAFDFAEDQSCLPNYPREGLIGEQYAEKLDPTELETFKASIGRFNGKAMYQGIKDEPAWRDDVKLCYIYTSGDITVPVDYQKNMVENIEKELNGKTFETVELDAGHSPSLTATKEVVDAIVSFTSQ